MFGFLVQYVGRVGRGSVVFRHVSSLIFAMKGCPGHV